MDNIMTAGASHNKGDGDTVWRRQCKDGSSPCKPLWNLHTTPDTNLSADLPTEMLCAAHTLVLMTTDMTSCTLKISLHCQPLVAVAVFVPCPSCSVLPHPAPYLESIPLYDAVCHVGCHLPQHCNHGDVGLTSSSGSTHKQVLIAAAEETGKQKGSY